MGVSQTRVPQLVATPEFYVSKKLFGGRWNVPNTTRSGAAAIEKQKSDLLDFYVKVALYMPRLEHNLTCHNFLSRISTKDNSMGFGTMVMSCIHTTKRGTIGDMTLGVSPGTTVNWVCGVQHLTINLNLFITFRYGPLAMVLLPPDRPCGHLSHCVCADTSHLRN